MDTRESGRIGGLRRAAKLSAEERSEIARKAVLTRWAKTNQKQRREFSRKMLNARWGIQRWGIKNEEKSLKAPGLVPTQAPFTRPRFATPMSVARALEEADTTVRQHLFQQLRSIAHEARIISLKVAKAEMQKKIELTNEFQLLQAEFSTVKERLDREMREKITGKPVLDGGELRYGDWKMDNTYFGLSGSLWEKC